jgi:aminomethyltransferase
MKETPILNEHKRLNARISPFGEWVMPIFYSGIIEEHKHCREKSCIFDICHMGEFIFTGDIAKSSIETAVTQSVSSIPVGKSKYGFILNENGGIIDDLIIFRLADDKIMLIVNASTIETDFKVLQQQIKNGTLTDSSSQTAKLDIQGPLSRNVIEDILKLNLNLEYFQFSHFDVLGEKILISRTGYTGELGYEIFTSNDIVVELWNKFINDARIKPAGLGARDILRLEVGYSLYGNALDENTTPLEAKLGMFVCFDKNFTGKDALLKEKETGPKKIKIAFKSDSRRTPRRHYKIISNGLEIGEVTSGSFSPSLSCGIGLGYVKPGFDKIGAKIEITDRCSTQIQAEIVNLPFYKGGSLKK